MTERPWGRWERLYADRDIELRQLTVAREGFSSPHYHLSQSNIIAVLEGRLIIRFLSGPDRELTVVGTVELEPNSPVIWIPPPRVHQFWAQTDVVAYETTIGERGAALDPDEIHRLGEAGKGTPKP